MTEETHVASAGDALRCDVLVIGGGIAGLLSAISARQLVQDVILVDKAFVGKTSESALSAAMTVVAPPGTEIEAWVKDLVESGDYISHQDIFYEALRSSFELIKRLEALGVKYPKDKTTGELLLQNSRGTRLVKATMHLGKALGEFTGGETVVMAYRNKAIREGVKIVNRVYVSSLLTGEGGSVIGAAGFDTRSGEAQFFLAKAVIVATGGSSFRGDYAHIWFATGDGLRLAYEAGAELENMEFNLFNTGSPFFWWEGTGAAIELGARFLNAKKEDFMKKYHPLGDRADIGFITRAMALEAKIGNGPPFYLALNEIPDPTGQGYGGGYWAPLKMVAWMPVLIDKMRDFYSYDVFKEPAEWMPAYHENGGGVRADISCATNVPGLFVSGQAMSTSPDLHTGWSFARFTWNGYKAGESAGRFAKGVRESPIHPEALRRAGSRMIGPLGRKGALTADNAYNQLRKTIFAYDVLLLKHEDRLTKALGDVRRLARDVLPKVAAPDAHELVKLKEFESMLLMAEMTLRASVVRTESRSCHFREDYPYMDNDNWLKWVVVRKSPTDGGMSLRTDPLPIGSRYKIVPPPGKYVIPMPRKVWLALRKKEPCAVSWTDPLRKGVRLGKLRGGPN